MLIAAEQPNLETSWIQSQSCETGCCTLYTVLLKNTYIPFETVSLLLDLWTTHSTKCTTPWWCSQLGKLAVAKSNAAVCRRLQYCNSTLLDEVDSTASAGCDTLESPSLAPADADVSGHVDTGSPPSPSSSVALRCPALCGGETDLFHVTCAMPCMHVRAHVSRVCVACWETEGSTCRRGVLGLRLEAPGGDLAAAARG